MRHRLWLILACLTWPSPSAAQQSQSGEDEQELVVTPSAVASPVLQHRLLPAEYELHDGNAAPILLRLPWEQGPFMTQTVPKFDEYLEIPLSQDEQIRQVGPGLSPRLYREMRRAAYRQTADWAYPLDEKPMPDILLPDLQGARSLVFRGLAVQIRFHIVSGQLDQAREAILVGLANSRHYARTPFIVCGMMAAANSNVLLYRLEELLQQPACPNFYWPLTSLPVPFINVQRTFEYERQMLQKSIDGLDELGRPRSKEQWRELADHMIKYLEDQNAGSRQPGDDFVTDAARMLDLARQELPKLEPGLAPSIAQLSDGELTVRWFIGKHNEISDRITAGSALSPPEAVERLRPIEAEIEVFTKETGLPCFFMRSTPLQTYLGGMRFDRRVAALRVVEGLRHFAASHDGKFPEKLDQLTDTPAPNDPLTGKPFVYKRNDADAIVIAPGIVVGGQARNSIVLRVILKKK